MQRLSESFEAVCVKDEIVFQLSVYRYHHITVSREGLRIAQLILLLVSLGDGCSFGCNHSVSFYVSVGKNLILPGLSAVVRRKTNKMFFIFSEITANTGIFSYNAHASFYSAAQCCALY